MQRTCTLLIYFIFFTVQLFFNIDITRIYSSASISSTQNISSLHTSKAKVQQAVNDHLRKSKNRLNKRFQPSTIPCSIIALPAVIPQYTSILKLPVIVDDYFNSFLLEALLLRGPPVVA
jgi:hypothetical protein